MIQQPHRLVFAEPFELPLKRTPFPMPDVEGIRCPKCNLVGTFEWEGDSVNYPRVGEASMFSQFCERCEDWFDFEARLDITFCVFGDGNARIEPTEHEAGQ